MTRSSRRLKAQVQETVSELPIHAARLAVMGVGQALLLTDRVRKDYREAREEGLGPVLGRLRDDAETLTGRLVNRIAGRGDGGTGTRPEAAQGPSDAGRTRAADGEIAVGKPRRPAATSRPAPGRTRPPAARTTPAAKPGPAAGGRTGGTKDRPAGAGRPKSGPVSASRSGATGATASPAAKPTPPAKPGPTSKAAPSTGKPAPKAAAAPKGARPAQGKAAAAKAEGGSRAKETPAAPARGAAGTAPDALPVPGYDQATLASVRGRLRTLDARQVTQLRDYERAHAARAEFLRMYENRLTKLRGGS